MLRTGSCLCGSISYTIDGALRDVINCHCVRCRKHTGHFMAATATQASNVRISGTTVRWYSATETVEYAFCSRCGSTLFWRSAERPDLLSIAAGTLDPPTGLSTSAALFTADASDYHDLDQNLIQYPKDRR